MLIRHVPYSDIQRIARNIGVTFEGNDKGKKFPQVHGRLIPDREIPKRDRKYRKVSASFFNQGRETFAVCWHGHRDFFRALFAEFPEATVTTYRMGLIHYTAENFEDTFPDTGWINVGPPIAPVSASDACKCPEGAF
jgi:hypothetical protein